jgi:hypothetical protein
LIELISIKDSAAAADNIKVFALLKLRETMKKNELMFALKAFVLLFSVLAVRVVPAQAQTWQSDKINRSVFLTEGNNAPSEAVAEGEEMAEEEAYGQYIENLQNTLASIQAARQPAHIAARVRNATDVPGVDSAKLLVLEPVVHARNVSQVQELKVLQEVSRARSAKTGKTFQS